MASNGRWIFHLMKVTKVANGSLRCSNCSTHTVFCYIRNYVINFSLPTRCSFLKLKMTTRTSVTVQCIARNKTNIDGVFYFEYLSMYYRTLRSLLHHRDQIL
ncbi:uncharacterized protein LOC125499843 [Athalia rosae]|uniref:uncharacterized protein LOC125499843 n=1 Tax=Athalia rosae TaxID=37344 RepID=UPI002033D378|nr:uncharacterized protein LOC125499843 [Athalia rosae]